ncbi:MAG: glycoside hydrolase family 2 TIM barrel-domain containing protein [Bacteroidota bacterium]
MRASYFLFVCLCLLQCGLSTAQHTETVYLSGTGNDQTKTWDFYCTDGMNSGKWSEIEVPSCWELQGFGQYTYGHTPWEDRLNEEGHYRTEFTAPKEWKNKQVEIVFEGVMTDAEVMINGKLAGPTHQGAFYEFSYDITDKISFNKKNKLEVEVKKHSANESINHAERKADFWIFGGIIRPVYLRIKPKEHIERIAIKAEADGSLEAHIFHQAKSAQTLSFALLSSDGDTLSSGTTPVDASQQPIPFSHTFSDIQSWNPESPTLYQFAYSLMDEKGNLLHEQKETIGFRTVEVREKDGIYVNGQKIKFKGVNRHTFWPNSGRTTNKDLSRQDVLLMKEMNMNAVRMSHYPPEKHFLDLCDSIGLFVIDELCTWQAPAVDTEVGEKLVKELVIRDVNHPSILLWANGNEGGFNTELDDDYAIWDIQQREVIHPWEAFGKTNTFHYIGFNMLTNDANTRSKIFFPTEFLHGLYDGGHGAGLEDYWKYMWADPLCAGGFLWVFADESVVRTDKGGALDSDGDHAPDGILGPYREKEGSFYTIKHIWSPVQIKDFGIGESFSGEILVENRYHFTDLSQCQLLVEWTYVAHPGSGRKAAKPLLSEVMTFPQTLPGETSRMKIPVPGNWQQADALTLKVINQHGDTIHQLVKAVKELDAFHAPTLQALRENQVALSVIENAEAWEVQAGKLTYSFDKNSGILQEVRKLGTALPFGEGPISVSEHDTIASVNMQKTNTEVRIQAFSKDSAFQYQWTVDNNGILHLAYSHLPEGFYGAKSLPFDGISFSLEEETVKGMKWVGDGPFRVWRNRMKGPHFGAHRNEYNNTITGFTGSTYSYPEFKGFYSQFYAAELELASSPSVHIFCHTPDIFLRMLTPEESPDVRENMKMSFPVGDISFLTTILPIGTKFKKPGQMGPQSQPETYYNFRNLPTEVELSFYFEE